ncbi:hypothetical protein ACHAWX_005984 [Stephanocyclus meneghinianus]
MNYFSLTNLFCGQGEKRDNLTHADKQAEQDEEELAASIFDELDESDYAASNCGTGDAENKCDNTPFSSTVAQSVTEMEAQASCGDEDDDLPMMSLKTKAAKKEKHIKTASSNISTLDTPKITPKPDSSSTLSSSALAPFNTTPSVATATTAPNEPKKSKKSSSHSHPKTKLFSGTLRSAAAAHRNRQIHVPPIGSPGLLMLPNPALVANFPKDYDIHNKNDGSSESAAQHNKDGNGAGDDFSKWLHNGYLLPRTVFEQSMIAGGYTFERRQNKPHRGSSTKRTVGDMFDSDVSLYLHFPELIPLDIWERRLGDKSVGQDELGGDGKKRRRKNPGKTDEEEEADRQGEASVNDEDETNHTSGNSYGPPTEPSGQAGSEDSISDGGSFKRPRLVDTVILSLSKLTGVNAPARDRANLHVGDSMKPDSAASDSVLSAGSSLAQHVASDLTPDELPKFAPSLPGTRKRCQPYQPMTFLDMIPISLTCTYPTEYVKKRRAYVQAVKEREHAIIESQEAADDAVDNKEKYQAHKEAWDRMFEYQKQQIAKRESAAEEAEQKAKEEGQLRGTSSSGDMTDDIENTAEEQEKKREDPMDYMPPPPEPPPPERFVSVPEIPMPPSPPSVVEIDDDSGDITRVKEEIETHLDKMRAPKLDPMLIQHLDPACFLPTVEGRYFGLLSNAIADPQFVGYNASGIRGVTSGGGTGLATSYVGGGRGAAGLVSGSLRGGSQWQQPREAQMPVSATPAPFVAPKPAVKKEKEIVVRAQPTDTVTVPAEAAPKITPSSSSSKKKKRAIENEDVESDSSNKKVKRAVPLATGDRNTTATEIASGPAGPDFPDGWTVKTYRRAGGETIGKTDRFWFSPGLNIRFRAKKHAMSFIDILAEPTINGDEDAAAEAYRSRGLHF